MKVSEFKQKFPVKYSQTELNFFMDDPMEDFNPGGWDTPPREASTIRVRTERLLRNDVWLDDSQLEKFAAWLKISEELNIIPNAEEMRKRAMVTISSSVTYTSIEQGLLALQASWDKLLEVDGKFVEVGGSYNDAKEFLLGYLKQDEFTPEQQQVFDAWNES